MRHLFLSFIFFCSLYGGSLEERVAILEKEVGQIGIKTEHTEFKVGFENQEFKQRWIGFYFFGAPLYWNAKVDGTEYIYDLMIKKESKTEDKSCGWDWGYLLGLGVHLPVVKWRVIGSYTHFGVQNREGKRGIPSFLISLKKGEVFSSLEARSNYKIDYDNIELNLHQNSFFSRFLEMETLLGIKQTWINQKQEMVYQNFENIRIGDRCQFEGVGPMIGFDMKWHVFYDVSFIGKAKSSLLLEKVKVKHEENEIILEGNSRLFVPTLYFFVGLSWNYPTCRTQFNLNLGYQAEYFWRQNQSVEMNNNKYNNFRIQLMRYTEDLTFYGAILRAEIAF